MRRITPNAENGKGRNNETPLLKIEENYNTKFKEDYNAKIEELRKLLKSSKTFQPAMKLAISIHAATHTATVSSSDTPTFCDHLLEGLSDEDYSVMPTEKDETIAWHLWHIARIEDLVGNLLIAEQSQILDDIWLDKLNVTVKDTGNVMTDEEIIRFSRQVNKTELIAYRNAVGRQTRKILHCLTPDDRTRKPRPEALSRLLSEGGLLEEKGSLWLLNFWGRHTVSGLILLPLTRHHMIHLPDSAAIKEFTRTNRTPFLS